MFGTCFHAPLLLPAYWSSGHAYETIFSSPLAIGRLMHENICIDGKSDAGVGGFRVSPKMVMILPVEGLRYNHSNDLGTIFQGTSCPADLAKKVVEPLLP